MHKWLRLLDPYQWHIWLVQMHRSRLEHQFAHWSVANSEDAPARRHQLQKELEKVEAKISRLKA